MRWSVPKIWEGGDVFILGGGPSLPKQFNIPDCIVQDVIAGRATPSIYSQYMSCLHDKHVIGINISYMIGNWIDMVFFGDKSFFLSNEAQLAKFTGLKVSCHPICERYRWIKYLPRNGSQYNGISMAMDKVSWNSNSGAAAISVAAHTGAKRIILLGFDMTLNMQGQQHWHDVYGRRLRDPKKAKALPFTRHLQGFTAIQNDARKMNIEILNCSEESVIPNFKKIKLSDVL